MPKRLILASASPRRRELLSLLRLPFEVVPSGVDEAVSGWVKAEMIVRHLAIDKAREVWMREHTHIYVLAADTIVVTERPGAPTILAKPRGKEDAVRMLRLLSGTTHTVYTGVALARPVDE